MRKRTALLSVYNKEGLIQFASALIKLGFDILASGGTARTLADAGLPVRNLSQVVGEPILGHRVVTLSRKVYAAILARNTTADEEELERIGMPRIDLVCVDMYPLEEAIKQPNATMNSVVEMTDIGGPTLLYAAAAKGGQIVIVDAAGRVELLDWLREGEPQRDEVISVFAFKARMAVIRYQMLSAAYHAKTLGISRKDFLETHIDVEQTLSTVFSE